MPCSLYVTGKVVIECVNLGDHCASRLYNLVLLCTFCNEVASLRFFLKPFSGNNLTDLYENTQPRGQSTRSDNYLNVTCELCISYHKIFISTSSVSFISTPIIHFQVKF